MYHSKIHLSIVNQFREVTSSCTCRILGVKFTDTVQKNGSLLERGARIVMGFPHPLAFALYARYGKERNSRAQQSLSNRKSRAETD